MHAVQAVQREQRATQFEAGGGEGTHHESAVNQPTKQTHTHTDTQTNTQTNTNKQNGTCVPMRGEAVRA